MTTAHINRIATAVPPHDVHNAFLGFAGSQLAADRRGDLLFRRMAGKGGIDHRYSWLQPGADPSTGNVDAAGFYRSGAFPSTAARMRFFERHAPLLAAQAVDRLALGDTRASVTHLIVTCCTGFSAPGLDLQILEHCGLPGTVERTMVGFMGCYAAMNALKLARHIIRSEPHAHVLTVNLELCTLHLQESDNIEQILSFMVFADGCAAALITADPHGIALDSFHAVLAPQTSALITWNIGESGFDMMLSGRVPAAIHDALCTQSTEIMDGASPAAIDLWAVHPGGRSVLDAVERALDLPPDALAASRKVLRDYGNMSSATVMFVLRALLAAPSGQTGCAMAFGPGLVAETMLFHTA